MSTLATLVVKLIGDVSGFTKSMDDVGASVRRTGRELTGWGAGLTATVTAPLALIGGAALKMSMDYEQAMNVLQAQTGASDAEMQKLSATAKMLGADITLPGTSASDAAEAMLELTKAGLSVEDTMNAVRGVLMMSAAAQISNARAAEITANALNMFNLAGSEAVRVADLLAAGANRSSASVDSLAMGMQMAGAVFASNNQNIEDLITSLAMLANAGIQGSDAGTALKTMLMSLVAPSDKARALMQSLGVSVFDSAGNMRAMPDIIAQFQGALVGLTAEERQYALATIFGADAVRAANILIGEGKGKYLEMRDAVTEAGQAQAMSQAQTAGLKGALDGLRSTIETTLLSAAEPFLAALTQIVVQLNPVIEYVGQLAQRFTELEPKTQTIILAVVGLAAALGPVLMVLGPIITGIGGVITVLGLLLSPIGLVVAAVVALGLAWATNFGGIRDKTTEVFDAVKGKVQAVMDFVKPYIETAMNFIRGVVETALGAIRDWWEQNGEAVKTIVSAWLGFVQNVFTTVLNAIRGVVEFVLGGIQAFWQRHGDTIRTVTQTAWNSIKTVVDTVLKVIGGIIRAVASAIHGDWRGFGENLRTVWDAAWRGIATILRNYVTILATIAQDIVRSIIGFFTNTDWGAVGRAVIQGIANGIRAGIEWVKEAARNVAQAAVDAAKGALGISSPSKVFAKEVGKPVIEGITVGMIQNLGTLLKAVSEVASKLKFEGIQEFGAALKGLFEGLSAVYNGEKGVLDGILAHTKPRLIAVVEWFNRLYPDIKAIAGDAGSASTAAAAVLKPVTELFDGLAALYAAEKGTLDGILAHTKPRLIAVVEWFGRLYPDIKNAAADAASASSATAEVMKPVNDLFSGLKSIYDAEAGRMDGILMSIRGQVIAVIDWFAKLYPDIKDRAAEAAASSKAASEVLGPVKAMFDGLAAIYGATKGELDGIFAHIRGQVISIINWFVNIYPEIRDNAALAQQSADVLDGVLVSVKKMMSGYTEILKLLSKSNAEKNPLDIEADLKPLFDLIRPQIVMITQWFHELWKDIEMFAQNAQKVADTLDPVMVAIKKMFESLKAAFAVEFEQPGFDGGKGLMEAFAQGITEWANLPVEALQAVLQKLRDMLPGSDAKFGPLSDLTASGRALPLTLARGIVRGTDAAEQAAQAMAGRLQPQWSGVATPLPNRAYMDNANAGNSTTVNIYNPVGEPSEMSMTRQLRNLAAIGVLSA